MAFSPKSVRDEITFPGVVQKGAGGMPAKRVQEWVTLHGHYTAVDSDFGPATYNAVVAFQTAKGIAASGIVDKTTWDALVLPMVTAAGAGASSGATVGAAALEVGWAHLRQRPFEVGGNNCGPWVRMYCEGNEGKPWRWCAYFVTFLLKQACDSTGASMPIAGSGGCDELADQAKAKGRFVPGEDIKNGKKPWSSLGASGVFLRYALVKKGAKTIKDYVHTGFALDGSGPAFDTIEGNTSQQQGSDDNQAWHGHRAIGQYDFVVLD